MKTLENQNLRFFDVDHTLSVGHVDHIFIKHLLNDWTFGGANGHSMIVHLQY